MIGPDVRAPMAAVLADFNDWDYAYEERAA
jgi:hypothetical protein